MKIVVPKLKGNRTGLANDTDICFINDEVALLAISRINEDFADETLEVNDKDLRIHFCNVIEFPTVEVYTSVESFIEDYKIKLLRESFNNLNTIKSKLLFETLSKESQTEELRRQIKNGLPF